MILGMITTATMTLTGTSILERRGGSQTEGPRIAETTELGPVMIIHCGGEGEVEVEVEPEDHPAEATTTMMYMEEVGEVVIQSTTGTDYRGRNRSRDYDRNYHNRRRFDDRSLERPGMHRPPYSPRRRGIVIYLKVCY